MSCELYYYFTYCLLLTHSRTCVLTHFLRTRLLTTLPYSLYRSLPPTAHRPPPIAHSL